MRSIRAAVALAVGALALAGCSESRPAATPPPGAAAVVQIATGSTHSCALLEDGTVRCWGDNDHGQLGDGTHEDRWTPVEVSSLAGVTAIAAGELHSCALLGDGTARCWGSNLDNALGDHTDLPSSIPVAVRYLEGAATSAAPGATILSARRRHTCAILAETSVRCWGDNQFGQLGDQTADDKWVAVAVAGLTGARSIAAGSAHTCALLADGSARCWGLNEQGRLGSAGAHQDCWGRPCASAPVGVPDVALAGAITAGDAFTCALMAGAGVRGWGVTSEGQLATEAVEYAGTPMILDYVWGIGTIAAGGAHACAISLEGVPTCWGRNDLGQLGHGAPTEHGRGRVEGLAEARAIAASAGHTCAVTPTRGVRCWGRNDQGQLGDGTNVDRRSAVAVVGLDR